MSYSIAERKLTQYILAAFPLGQTIDPPQVSNEEWSVIERLADRNGLLPLLYIALRKLEALERVPSEIQIRLRDAYWRTTVSNQLALEELGSLLTLFQDAKIPVVVLKGFALATWLYPTEGSRPSSDIDVLVSSGDKDRARSLLMENGWELDPRTIDFRRPFLGQESFQKVGRLPIHVEVHSHVLDLPYYIQNIPMDWFWQRTLAAQIQDRPAMVFSPTAQLLHLCAHLGIHHQESRFIWSYDLALLLAHHHPEIDWREIAEAMQTFGLTSVVLQCLEQVRTLWQVDLPPAAKKWIEYAQPTLKERLIARSMEARQIAGGPVWDGLFAPRLRSNGGYWRQALFPSKELMRARYNIHSPLPLLLMYAWRITAGLLKFLLSMVTVVAGSRRAV